MLANILLAAMLFHPSGVQAKSGQGCVNEGADRRKLAWLICPFQRAASFKSTVEPASVTVGFPPVMVVNLPLFWKKPQPIPGAAKPVRPVLHIRFGWRKDYNYGGYIPSTAIKEEERSKFW